MRVEQDAVEPILAHIRATRALDDPIVNRFMQQNAAHGTAGLTLPAEIHAADRAGRDLVAIGIGKGDQRILAAQFERDMFDRGLGGGLLDRHARRRLADKGDAFHARVPNQRLAGFAATGDDVDHARR